MKSYDRNLIIITIFAFGFIAVWIYAIIALSKDCESKGGTIISGYGGVVYCIKAERIE